jgi:hypothetical protein
MQISKLSILLLTVFLAASAFAQKAQTFTGTISDSMCTNKHMLDHMKATSEADCVRKCAKEGFDYALVVGKDYYILKGDPQTFDKYAGQKVTVKGTLNKDELTAESVTPVAGGKSDKPAGTKKKSGK